jgi:hypothetical protein
VEEVGRTKERTMMHEVRNSAWVTLFGWTNKNQSWTNRKKKYRFSRTYAIGCNKMRRVKTSVPSFTIFTTHCPSFKEAKEFPVAHTNIRHLIGLSSDAKEIFGT